MKKIIDGFLAGMMISIGGAVFMACYEQYRVIGAVLFCVGLLTVCWKGYSLYTGRIGLMIEHHTKEDWAVLLLGLLGNAVSSIVFGYLIAYAIPSIKEAALIACTAKLSQGYLVGFIRGILCGILIYLSIDIYKNHKSVLGVLLCVPAFILSGYEHSIADIFYFAASGIASAKAFGYIWMIILGNSVGGLLIPTLNLLKNLTVKKTLMESNDNAND